MNAPLRYIAIGIGVAISLGSVTACDDRPADIPDVLAQDSTLEREVMSARGDTSLAMPDSMTPDYASAVPASGVPLDAPRPSLSPDPAPVSRPAPRARAASASRSPSVSRHITRHAAMIPARKPERTTRQAIHTSPPATKRSSPRAIATGVVASGSVLTLLAGQRICSYASRVGDTFNNLVYQPVEGTNGAVIPRGALVKARIISIGRHGSQIGVRAESVRIHGRTYPLSSDVSYATRGTKCVPERTVIESELAEPVTILASSTGL